MTTQYFTLDDGVLELHEGKVVIFDKAKRNKLRIRFGAICSIISSVFCIGRGFEKNDNVWLFFGILLLLFWALVIISNLKKSVLETVDSETNIEDISVVTFKNSRTGQTKVGEIKTKQNKIRQILISKANLQDIKLRDELNKMNIETLEK